MIGEVKNEIANAISKLGLTQGEIYLLDNNLGEKIYFECLEYFVKSGDRRWWWEDFRFPSFSVQDLEHPFEHLNDVIPMTDENVWLIVEENNEPFYPVYDCNPNIIKSVLSECFGFEYYIIDKGKKWLLCENHHNRLIAIGDMLTSNSLNWQPG